MTYLLGNAITQKYIVWEHIFGNEQSAFINLSCPYLCLWDYKLFYFPLNGNKEMLSTLICIFMYTVL